MSAHTGPGCEPGCPEHHCHAWRCRAHVPAALLMCRRHWFMVPPTLRAEVWRTYRSGQEQDKRPSRAYLQAALRAVAAVAEREAKSEWQRVELVVQEELPHVR